MPTEHFSFLLLPQFSMLAFSAAIEPLRIANQLSGQTLYSWENVSTDGAAVQCSNGTALSADVAIADARTDSSLFVCSGVEPQSHQSKRVSDWVRHGWRRGRIVGGLCTGAYTLAHAGILENSVFTLHWENLDRCCQTNENSHRIAGAALIYALNSWRHSVRAAVRLILKLSRE